MTFETYENLRRVNDRRIKSARRKGNWKVVNECVSENIALDAKYMESQKDGLSEEKQ